MDTLALYLILALTLATWAAWIADRRGRNFWVYVVVCTLIPVASLVSIPYLLIFTRRVRTPAESYPE